LFGLVRNVFVGPFSVLTRYLTTLFLSTIWQGLHHYAHFFKHSIYINSFFLLFNFPIDWSTPLQLIFTQNYLIRDFSYYHCNYTYRFCILYFLLLIAISKYLISLDFLIAWRLLLFNSFMNVTNLLTVVNMILVFFHRIFSLP